MRVRHFSSIKREEESQPSRCNMAEQSGKCTYKKAQESGQEENASSKPIWHRKRGNPLLRSWEHEGDTGEIMLSFPQELGKEGAVVMANGASLCIWKMTLVLWADLQCRREEAQCQDCGAGALTAGSAHCKKALQDKGPPAEHRCPPNFTP